MTVSKRVTIDAPKGVEVHLGNARRLTPSLSESDGLGTGYHRARTSTNFVSEADMMLQADDPGLLPRQRLKFALTPLEEEVFLRDRGLTTSYGIFGAPGSGKTFLYKYLLRQVLAVNRADPERKIGALILDPKAALIDDLQAIVAQPDVARSDDLLVINAEMMAEGLHTNVIDCGVDTWALADLLVLAARSAGITASEDYWFLEWANLFGASLFLLNNFNLEGVSNTQNAVTLRGLMDALLLTETVSSAGSDSGDRSGMRGIQRLAAEARLQLDRRPPEVREDALIAINQIERFFKADYVHTIMAFIARAYGPFQRHKYSCFSPERSRSVGAFYDEIIEDGRIVLVSMSATDPLVAKTLCTLIKCLFQQTVIQRFGRLQSRRVVLLGCDEYAEIASEVPGQPMGDGRFFSLSREFGCMGLLATQSVNVLQATSLKENWRSVFSTFGAKIFMRLADNETAKEATELAGKGTWYVTSRGVSHGKEGLSGSEQKSIQQFDTVPSEVTTQGFEKGDAVAIGSLDGNATPELLHFFHVPSEDEQDARIAAAQAQVQAAGREEAPAISATPTRRAVFEDE